MSEIEQSPSQILNSDPELATSPSRFEDTATTVTSETHNSVKEADWFTLARKLRQRNRELLKRVADLEQALAQMQEELAEGSPRPASVASLALLPPDDALRNAQAQVERLCQELEESHSVAQRQQFLIESLGQQLEATQTQLAHWEREHLAAQQRHRQQVELLTQATENSQALNRQLERQQAQAAQFKTTLAECFTQAQTTPDPTAASVVSQDAPSSPVPALAPVSTPAPKALTPPVSPANPPANQTAKTIQPWSAPASTDRAAAPPSWATRLLGLEHMGVNHPAVTTTTDPTTSTDATPDTPAKPQLQSHLPIPRSAPAGKFANLLLPAFNSEAAPPITPKVVREPATPVTPAAPPILSAPSRPRSSIAAVDLPTFPRQ